MTKPAINQLGAVGLMLDGDPTMLPDNAFTDALNIRFNGREIEQTLGNVFAPYYTSMGSEQWTAGIIWQMQPVIFDGFSNGARLLFCLVTVEGQSGNPDTLNAYQQNMSNPEFKWLTVMDGWPTNDPWSAYKGQINNCPFFGMEAQAPVGKQYDWTGFDSLPGWGEQTGGDQVVVNRRWTCKKLVAFDNRLIMLNTTEETNGGVDVPYPTRLRWSGFCQENAFPINWDDTAANRTPEDFAAAVIDGYAGWQDLTSSTEVIDACENGGTLLVYTERETFSLTPSGNDQSPFITKLVYSDLGVLDIGCSVNAKGYNYVFTGSDVVRHDSVSWKSIADGACREWLADLVAAAAPGMVRMINYPELNEIWVMCRGDDQDNGDYCKTQALTYNYINGTWSKRTLPYIYDAVFAPLAPESDMIPTVWDNNPNTWDAETKTWDTGRAKVSQGTMIGSCGAGGVYYLNSGYKESRHVYSGSAWTMQGRDLQCYAERRGMEFGVGFRYMIQETYLNGRGTDPVMIKLGRSDNPDGGYTWETQNIVSLATQRKLTWRTEGEAHGYRLEISGRGSIPVGITFKVTKTGGAY
ncbi:hypothetical protein ACQVA2_13745 [Citrobacter sp. OP27]